MLSRDEVDAIAVRIVSVLNDVAAGCAVTIPMIGEIDPAVMWPELRSLFSREGRGSGPTERRAILDMPPQELAQYVVTFAEAIVAQDDAKWSFRALALASGSCADIFFTLKRAARGEQEFRYDTVYRLIILMRERFPNLDPVNRVME